MAKELITIVLERVPRRSSPFPKEHPLIEYRFVEELPQFWHVMVASNLADADVIRCRDAQVVKCTKTIRFKLAQCIAANIYRFVEEVG